jgi:phage I-like protein
MPKTQTQPLFAACAVALSGNGPVVQLFPAGKFDAPRGAMKGAGPWLMDQSAALSVITDAAARENDLAIDYEHQLLNAAANGKPAPAAGWIDPQSLQWRPGEGLYARVSWTDAAASAIQSDEYRYLSPVFTYDKKSGRVLSLHMAAITNNPAIDGMAQLAAATANLYNPPQEPSMKELLKRLGLDADATEEQALAALTALQDAHASLETQLAEKDQALAAASADPDPAKYVPVDAVTQLQTEVAALTAQLNDSQVNDLIDTALSEGKLVPAMEDWARELGRKDLAALSAYLDAAPAVAALAGSQTEGRDRDTQTAALTAEEQWVAGQLGISETDFAAAKAADQQA